MTLAEKLPGWQEGTTEFAQFQILMLLSPDTDVARRCSFFDAAFDALNQDSRLANAGCQVHHVGEIAADYDGQAVDATLQAKNVAG